MPYVTVGKENSGNIELYYDDVPTLVIHGDADRILPITATGQRTAKLIQGARLLAVKDGPHCIPWTHAEEVNAELLNFLGKKAGKSHTEAA